MVKYILEIIYHYSTYLSSWSWQKLYGNREKGYGYKKDRKADNWDGKSRPSNKAYDDNYDRIFGQKQIKELDESLKQSKRNRQEREDNEAYLKEIKNKL